MNAPTEKQIERACIKLYESVGCKVLKFSQPFKAAQTRGIPDLKIYNERRQVTWWHEVKRPKGKMSEHQLKIQALVQQCGEHHYVGGIEAAKLALTDHLGITFLA